MAATEPKPEQIKAVEPLDLTPEESAWLLELLQKPAPEPTEKMLRASERRRELLGK